MDRLLSSSPPTSLRIHLKRSPFLPSFGRFGPARCNFSSSKRSNLRRAHLSSSTNKTQFPFSVSASSSITENDWPSSSTSQANFPDGSKPKSQFLNQIRPKASENRKAVTAGILAILTAAATILIQPVFAPDAFATIQTAAKTGGPAAASVGGKLMSRELLSSAWTGFLAGCLHTLSGPDHLAALTPLSIGRTQLESAAVGALWGCGHDAGQVIFGLIFVLLKDRLHIEIIRTWGARVVGFTLLVIGVMGIKEASEVPTPCIAMENGECEIDVYENLENPTVRKKKVGFPTFATGIIHGLQPDAVMMVLPALALPSRLAGAAFLMMFLLGTVAAMGSYTVFIGSCSRALKDRVPRITEKLTWASSLIAIALGFAIIISQFFGYSLY